MEELRPSFPTSTRVVGEEGVVGKISSFNDLGLELQEKASAAFFLALGISEWQGAIAGWRRWSIYTMMWSPIRPGTTCKGQR